MRGVQSTLVQATVRRIFHKDSETRQHLHPLIGLAIPARERQMDYPILDFDPTPEAIIEPSQMIKPRDVPEHCVICFFSDVIEKVIAEKNAKVIVDNRWEDGPHLV